MMQIFKFLLLIVCSLGSFNLKSQVALPVAAAGNVLVNGTTASNASVASTTTTGFKFSINGAIISWGLGTNSVTSPTIYFRNTTASTGRIYAINSDNSGLFSIADATGTTSPLTHNNRFVINSTGNIGIGMNAPTSLLHLKAGTNVLAPLKFTSGVNLTTASAGAMEYDGSNLYFTPTTVRKTIAFSDLSNATYTSNINFINPNSGSTEAVAISMGQNSSTNASMSLYYGNASNTVQGANTSNLIANMGSTGGMNLLVVPNAPMNFSTNLTKRMTILGNGNVGIGTTTPSSLLHIAIPTGSSYNNIVNVSGIDYTFNLDRYNQSVPILPVYGIDNQYGLTWYNDGNNGGTALVSNQKIITYGFATVTEKVFRLTDAGNNLGNFSLEMKNTSASNPNPSNVWTQMPNTSVISAWNHPLNIGSNSNYPVRIYADGGTANKIADIYIAGSRVGMGTETPNANSKLDVNGNIYCNSKIYIGTADANTQTRIANYALAVNGSAIFNKAKVMLYNTPWPDYVFEKDYELPSLNYLENYINIHKHLPEVPSAAEVQKDGIDLGDMQSVLLKKMEELTLHVIEMNKQVTTLSKKVEELKKENAELKDLLKK